jgi:hypothetical protein
MLEQYLLEHEGVAKEYEKLKIDLAIKYNRDLYTLSKTEFIKKHTKIAKEIYKDVFIIRTKFEEMLNDIRLFINQLFVAINKRVENFLKMKSPLLLNFVIDVCPYGFYNKVSNRIKLKVTLVKRTELLR